MEKTPGPKTAVSLQLSARKERSFRSMDWSAKRQGMPAKRKTAGGGKHGQFFAREGDVAPSETCHEGRKATKKTKSPRTLDRESRRGAAIAEGIATNQEEKEMEGHLILPRQLLLKDPP